jgi:hypothetical protein
MIGREQNTSSYCTLKEQKSKWWVTRVVMKVGNQNPCVTAGEQNSDGESWRTEPMYDSWRPEPIL